MALIADIYKADGSPREPKRFAVEVCESRGLVHIDIGIIRYADEGILRAEYPCRIGCWNCAVGATFSEDTNPLTFSWNESGKKRITAPAL